MTKRHALAITQRGRRERVEATAASDLHGCHPALELTSRSPPLREVCGLKTEEIAHALSAARRSRSGWSARRLKISRRAHPVSGPRPTTLPERLKRFSVSTRGHEGFRLVGRLGDTPRSIGRSDSSGPSAVDCSRAETLGPAALMLRTNRGRRRLVTEGDLICWRIKSRPVGPGQIAEGTQLVKRRCRRSVSAVCDQGRSPLCKPGRQASRTQTGRKSGSVRSLLQRESSAVMRENRAVASPCATARRGSGCRRDLRGRIEDTDWLRGPGGMAAVGHGRSAPSSSGRSRSRRRSRAAFF